jgi:hypothetical protein
MILFWSSKIGGLELTLVAMASPWQYHLQRKELGKHDWKK